MDKTYKSSKGILFLDFLKKFFWTAFAVLLVAVMVQLWVFNLPFNEASHPFLLLGAYIMPAAAFAFYLSFIRLDITAKVTDDKVILLRGKKAFTEFSNQDFIFSSYIVKEYYVLEAFTVATLRYLKVLDRDYEEPEFEDTWNIFKGIFRKDPAKKFRLCFYKKDYEEFISEAVSINLAQEQKHNELKREVC